MQDVDSKLDYIDGILEYQKFKYNFKKGLAQLCVVKIYLKKKDNATF